jgi:hypothetical protein
MNHCYVGKVASVLMLKAVQKSMEKWPDSRFWLENLPELDNDHSIEMLTVFPSVFSLSHLSRSGMGTFVSMNLKAEIQV